jgi:hypothetical protein
MKLSTRTCLTLAALLGLLTIPMRLPAGATGSHVIALDEKQGRRQQTMIRMGVELPCPQNCRRSSSGWFETRS